MSLLNQLIEYKKKQDFHPGLLGLFINPFFFARWGLRKHIKDLAFHLSGEIIDVGCGRKPYKTLFNVSKYVGIDIEQSGHSHADENIDVFYDGKVFPFQDFAFDNAICNQVLEHVFNPDEFLTEIHRVLKPGGQLLLTVPFSWDEHEQPYDYARYSSFGLKHLLLKTGFEVIESRKSVNDVRAIFQLLNAYFYKATLTKSGIINLLIGILYSIPINLIGSLLGFILPKNNDFYLDNIVLAKKI